MSNMVVILYDGSPIDGRIDVKRAISDVLHANLGTVNVNFITPGDDDTIFVKEDTRNDLQEAIDHAVVLVSELANSSTSSIVAFATKLSVLAVNNEANILQALFTLKDVESLSSISSEVRKTYKFNKTHLDVCKQVYHTVVK